MKKNVRKMLAVVLALMMLISIIPMATLAAEEDEVEPAAVCNHSYDETVLYSCTVIDGSLHKTVKYSEYVCLLCGYKYQKTHSTTTAVHTFTYTLLGITTNDDGVAIYTYEKRCTACGYTTTVNLTNPL